MPADHFHHADDFCTKKRQVRKTWTIYKQPYIMQHYRVRAQIREDGRPPRRFPQSGAACWFE